MKNFAITSDMLTMSFGYAIEVSPLHTLMLYNAVANGGKMMKPYLVNSIKSNGVVVKEVELFTWEKLDYVDRVKEAFGL